MLFFRVLNRQQRRGNLFTRPNMTPSLNSFGQFRCCLFLHVRSGAILYGLFRVIFHVGYLCIIFSVLLRQFQFTSVNNKNIDKNNSSHFYPSLFTTTTTKSSSLSSNLLNNIQQVVTNSATRTTTTTAAETVYSTLSIANDSFPLTASQLQLSDKDSAVFSLVGHFPARQIIGQGFNLMITLFMLHGVAFYRAQSLIPFLLLLIFELTGTIVSFFTLMVNQRVAANSAWNSDRGAYQRNFSFLDNDALLFQLALNRGNKNTWPSTTTNGGGPGVHSSNLFSALFLLCFKSYMVCMIWNCYRYLQFMAAQRRYLRQFSNNYENSNRNPLWNRMTVLMTRPFTLRRQQQQDQEDQLQQQQSNDLQNGSAIHTLIGMPDEALDSQIPPTEILPPSYEDLIKLPPCANMPPSYTSLEMGKNSNNNNDSSS